MSVLAVLVSKRIWFLYCGYKAGVKKLFLIQVSGHKQGREIADSGLNGKGFGRQAEWSTPTAPAPEEAQCTITHRFDFRR